MFGEAQRRKAVDVCFRGCVTLKKVIAELGYPSEGCLTNWMARDPRHGRRSPPPYTLDVRARAAGRVIAGERCVDVAKDVGRSATSVRKRAGAYGREGIGGLMNMGDGIRVPAVDDGVFSQVGVSFFSQVFFRVWARGVPAGGWLLVLWFAEHEGLADAVALSGEFYEPSVVDDAVDDRGGEFVVGEDRAPFAELDVRGEDDAPPFVRVGDDPVEQPGPVDVEGHVAELVEDEQVGFVDVAEHGVEAAVAFGLAELEHELGGGQEPDAHVPFDGLHAQGGGQMGLAAPGPAVEHEVLGLGDEVQ